MYQFDKMTNRRGTGSLKWDVPERELPMWVADMDFETAPAITEELIRRAEHGIFGYSVVTEDWYAAYQNWWKRRHHLEIEKDWLIFCTGVVPAISSIVRKLTTPAENVLVQTPVYNISSIPSIITAEIFWKVRCVMMGKSMKLILRI